MKIKVILYGPIGWPPTSWDHFQKDFPRKCDTTLPFCHLPIILVTTSVGQSPACWDLSASESFSSSSCDARHITLRCDYHSGDYEDMCGIGQPLVTLNTSLRCGEHFGDYEDICVINLSSVDFPLHCQYTNTKKAFNVGYFQSLTFAQTPTSCWVTSKLTSESRADVN